VRCISNPTLPSASHSFWQAENTTTPTIAKIFKDLVWPACYKCSNTLLRIDLFFILGSLLRLPFLVFASA
jgi:hypothetical protein